MRSMVSSTRKISAPFSSSSFPAFMATPMTAPSSAQGAGETGAADRLAARRRFSLFFTGQAPLVICAARVRSDPPAGARKNTGIFSIFDAVRQFITLSAVRSFLRFAPNRS